ncbi:hypothetical protein BZA77DRAFT_355660 [Pyronema omphalodes]|nr:hypothetical protein BZA77DRAFT_355660 [Pyronema omphalodes]
MPSHTNSSPGMFSPPLFWQLDSPIDDMDVDAQLPQQPPPQQANGFFQGFDQASGDPQNAIPADIQYSRNSEPGMFSPPLFWQLDSPIDDMDVGAQLPQQPPPQQANGFFQGFDQASGDPQNAIPADIQYSRNSEPGMLPRPPFWQLGSPIDDMDVDAQLFFQGFVQASSDPQNAIPADIQYSRNSDPAPTPDRQSPIDNMATPTDILLGPLQRMNISPGYISGEPSGLHNEMPANIQNPPAAHVPPVSTVNVADAARWWKDKETDETRRMSDEQAARIKAARIQAELKIRDYQRRAKMHEYTMNNSADERERVRAEKSMRKLQCKIWNVRDKLHNPERRAREMSRVVRGLD